MNVSKNCIQLICFLTQISHGIGLNSEDRPTSPQAISTRDLKNKLLEWAQQATEGWEEGGVTG